MDEIEILKDRGEQPDLAIKHVYGQKKNAGGFQIHVRQNGRSR